MKNLYYLLFFCLITLQYAHCFALEGTTNNPIRHIQQEAVRRNQPNVYDHVQH